MLALRRKNPITWSLDRKIISAALSIAERALRANQYLRASDRNKTAAGKTANSQKMANRRGILSRVFLALAIAGIALAVYHAYDEITYYSGPATSFCNINKTFSCQQVFAFSHPFGIELYVFGIVWFPLVLIVFLLPQVGLNRMILIPLLMVGNMFTVYLWWFDLAVVYPAVHAFCPVCLSMYFVNYAFTIVAAFGKGA
jgi:uncharacterized membrane protein